MAVDVQSHYRGPFVYPVYSEYLPSPKYDTPLRSTRRSSPEPAPAKSPRSCPHRVDRQGLSKKAFMSEQQTERAPPDDSASTRQGTPHYHQHYHYSQQPTSSTQSTPGPADSQSYGPSPVLPRPTSTSPAILGRSAGAGRDLPPLPHAANASGGSFPPASRSAGVLSILNPAEPDDGQLSRRRKASELESPSSSMPFLPPLGAGVQSNLQTGATSTPARVTLGGSLGERPPRRILTPRSPSLHRAASLNHLNPAPTTGGVQPTHYAGSPRDRNYTIEPGTAGAPSLPTPPAAVWQGYGFPGPTATSYDNRRASTGATRGMMPTSESTSPRSSYSSYSQMGQTSPAMQPLPGQYSVGPGPSMAGSGPTSVHADRQRHVGVPISSAAGQNVYQMMTLETTSGTVQLPVDVQAASRVADDKRKRNAGASARFRQRRKEKEKEASTTISRLEQQAKELTEDMDFYKRERDYLAGVVLQVPGGDRHFPRPQSPRLRRSSTLVTHGGGGGGGVAVYGSLHDQGTGSPDEGRSVRRRTSTLSLPAPSVYQPTYPPSGFGQPLAPHPAPPSALPSPLVRGTVAAPPPPQLMQAPPHTGPWNPYGERRPQGNSNSNREGR